MENQVKPYEYDMTFTGRVQDDFPWPDFTERVPVTQPVQYDRRFFEMSDQDKAITLAMIADGWPDPTRIRDPKLESYPIAKVRVRVVENRDIPCHYRVMIFLLPTKYSVSQFEELVFACEINDPVFRSKQDFHLRKAWCNAVKLRQGGK